MYQDSNMTEPGTAAAMLEAVFSSDEAVFLAVRMVLILAATIIIARIFDSMLERRFRQLSRRADVSKTSYTLLRRIVNVGIYLIGIGAAIYVVPQLRQLSLALFASAGFLGIVVGLAAQNAFSNVISGVFLVIFQPFRVGDRIETKNHSGTVEDITLRHTVIKTPANERVVVPNTQISDDYIVNYTIRDAKARFSVDFGISYDSDIDAAREIIQETAADHERTYGDETEVFVTELADSAVVLRMNIWAADRGEAWQAAQDLREQVKKQFDEEGIDIPFPQRDIHMHGDEQPS